jgi:hypothetical protein
MDTMIFVITYRVSQPGKELLFLFNDNSSINAFESISLGQSMADTNSGLIAKYVRLYSGENEIAIPLTPDGKNERRKNNGFVNCVTITGLNADDSEHNVFITLVPKEGILARGLSETIVKAVIPGEKEPITKSDTLPISNISHDPNYITVKPTCLVFPKAGKVLDYHVHFQNTGAGEASRVTVTVKIPPGVNMSTDISYHTPNSTATFYQLSNGNCQNGPPYMNSGGDSLLFEFVKNSGLNCTLEGMGSTSTCMCNEKTIGDFWFTIKTNNQMPDILLAQASIVFYNTDPLHPSNAAIITNVAVSQFRECCDCNKSCNPCSKRKGFWKWLFCKKC